MRDGDTVAIEGFTHLICFAAGHEIIRQRKRDLTLCRMTPDLIYDQMIAAGVAASSSSRWLGNPGVGSPARGPSAHRRRATPAPLELEEYSHFGMVARYTAGAMNLPFFPLRSYYETDLPEVNPLIRPHRVALRRRARSTPSRRSSPDVAIIHAQRADAAGDTQVWGLLGCQKEAAFAADRRDRRRRGAGRRVGHPRRPQPHDHPGLIVDAVVVEPFGAHPSYVQGYYDRDNRFYWSGMPSPRRGAALDAWLDEYVHGVAGRAEYMERLGDGVRARIRPTGSAPSGSVDYGEYR